ncbi:hypothetical protein ACFFWD_31550 [Bradyrhizobium erythrophlei]|uniref:hypothetical protein n=1 Tax=Bradyrhizobium erythrophlei TaxID=1437360 RepID=UPI0035E496C4
MAVRRTIAPDLLSTPRAFCFSRISFEGLIAAAEYQLEKVRPLERELLIQTFRALSFWQVFNFPFICLAWRRLMTFMCAPCLAIVELAIAAVDDHWPFCNRISNDPDPPASAGCRGEQTW